MSNEPKASINWDPYIQDVMSVYITQNKSAKETIQYLRENHGLEAPWVKSCSSPLSIQSTNPL